MSDEMYEQALAEAQRYDYFVRKYGLPEEEEE